VLNQASNASVSSLPRDMVSRKALFCASLRGELARLLCTRLAASLDDKSAGEQLLCGGVRSHSRARSDEPGTLLAAPRCAHSS
jgi:hypothetical protein